MWYWGLFTWTLVRKGNNTSIKLIVYALRLFVMEECCLGNLCKTPLGGCVLMCKNFKGVKVEKVLCMWCVFLERNIFCTPVFLCILIHYCLSYNITYNSYSFCIWRLRYNIQIRNFPIIMWCVGFWWIFT